jgi:hypothetical protein
VTGRLRLVDTGIAGGFCFVCEAPADLLAKGQWWCATHRYVGLDEATQDEEAAPNEETAKWARWQLDRLQGVRDPEPLEEAGEGACEDCELKASLLSYGRLKLCRVCASRRRRVRGVT